MLVKKVIVLIILIIFHINSFANCNSDKDILEKSCPNIFILEQVNTLTSNIDIKITNTSPVKAAIQLIANFQGGSNLCGSNNILLPKQSIIVNLSCVVNSFPYTLRDIDGRSNTLTISLDCENRVGAPCKGGLIFQTKTASNLGKIVSIQESDSDLWNCTAPITAKSFTDGRTNTNNINAECSGSPSPPTKFCTDLITTDSSGRSFTNWYLPAIAELSEIYSVRADVKPSAIDGYWSSTERNSSEMYTFDFTTGTIATGDKSTDTADIMCVNTF